MNVILFCFFWPNFFRFLLHLRHFLGEKEKKYRSFIYIYNFYIFIIIFFALQITSILELAIQCGGMVDYIFFYYFSHLSSFFFCWFNRRFILGIYFVYIWNAWNGKNSNSNGGLQNRLYKFI